MKKSIFNFLCIVIVISLSNSLFAQSKMMKRLEKGQIEKVEKQVLKILEEEPENIDALFTYATLLSTDTYSNFNLETAYLTTQKLKKAYLNFNNEKEVKKLDENGINHNSITDLLKYIIDRALNKAKLNNKIDEFVHFLEFYQEADYLIKAEAQSTIYSLAFDEAKRKNTLVSYLNFIQKYPKSTLIAEAKSSRNQLGFDIAKSENTIAGFQYFIKNFPEANQINKAIELRDGIAFEKANEMNTAEAFNNFISEYPKSHLIKKAKGKVEEFDYLGAKSKNTSEGYFYFLKKWPNSTNYDSAFSAYEELQFNEQTVNKNLEEYKDFITNFPSNSFASIAEDSLYHISLRNKDLTNLDFLIGLDTSEYKDKALISYYKIYTDDGEKRTLDKFLENFKNRENINEVLLDSLFEAGQYLSNLGDALYLNGPFISNIWSKYDEYIKLAAPNERAFLALQKIISGEIEKKNWTKAYNTVLSYLPYFQSGRKKVDNLLSILIKPVDPNIKVNNLGPNINTVQGGEYTPFITADDKNLYFCGRNRDNFNLDEDIFVSKRGKNGFKPATAITELNETGNNQAPLSLSADGTSMILFIDGKLSLAEKNIDNKWEILESFPETINSGTWQADARITSDKKALIFSSIRPTNFDYYPESNLSNYHGALNYPCDIYVSVRDENDEWTEPINLGPTINTIYSDRSPFLHPDMKTLYFASDGHGGLGNYDLFKSTRLADTCWDCWSEPVNLGKEFNTIKGDWGLDISTDGDKAYFSKGVEASGKNFTVNNEFDIFWSNIPGYLRPNYVATINGKLVDSKNQPVVANIRWEDLEAKKVIGIAKSDPEDGSYFIVLPLGKLYGYYIDDDNLFPVSSSIDLRNYKLQININNDIKIITYQDMLDNKVSASMNNIFFKTGSSSLEPTSLPELKRIAFIIKEKNVKVNILGHTDNIGSDAVNVALSLERANKIKQILINEGCNDADVITKGMGKSMPIASNNTEAGRAKNRRVDIIFEKK